MNINKQIGAKIKMIREANNIKQVTLARQVGISIQTLSSIENGKSEITLTKLDKLAKGLQVNVNELLAGYCRQILPAGTNHPKETIPAVRPSVIPDRSQRDEYESVLLRQNDSLIRLQQESLVLLEKVSQHIFSLRLAEVKNQAEQR